VNASAHPDHNEDSSLTMATPTLPTFDATEKIIEDIATITAEHIERLNAELALTYPDTPDAAWSVAIGMAIAMSLERYPPEQRAKVVENINTILATSVYPVYPWRLLPVS
jgi:hypothetical protein